MDSDDDFWNEIWLFNGYEEYEQLLEEFCTQVPQPNQQPIEDDIPF